jgi:putative phosphoesterase
MLIGVLSDTHDQVPRTRQAVALLLNRGAQALLHCGDLTNADVVHECVGVPSYFVFGNCDFAHESLRRAMTQIGATCLEKGGLITLGGRRLAITHGDSQAELRSLTAQDPDFLFTGHTHVAADVKKGSTRWVNPGALHRAPTWTVALVDLESMHVSVLEINNAGMHV